MRGASKSTRLPSFARVCPRAARGCRRLTSCCRGGAWTASPAPCNGETFLHPTSVRPRGAFLAGGRRSRCGDPRCSRPSSGCSILRPPRGRFVAFATRSRSSRWATTSTGAMRPTPSAPERTGSHFSRGSRAAVDHVHLILGNHDLARVGELAAFDDATFRDARRRAADVYASRPRRGARALERVPRASTAGGRA